VTVGVPRFIVLVFGQDWVAAENVAPQCEKLPRPSLHAAAEDSLGSRANEGQA